MHSAIFFLSTPRCGTQWIAKNLAEAYSDVAEVVHEPIGYDYNSRHFYREYESEDICNIKEVKDHIDYIRNVIKNKIYIEVGFPLYAALPSFGRKFNGSVKFIHLVRNPIPTAYSMVTHKIYSSKRKELNEKIMLYPQDKNVFLDYYKNSWSQINDFEKCLFYWSEIQMYYFEIKQRMYNVPMMSLRYEDILEEPEKRYREIVDFIDLPWRREVASRLNEEVDEYKNKIDEPVQIEKVYNHPQTVALALRFGYSVDTIDKKNLDKRYTHYRSTIRKILDKIRYVKRRASKVIKKK